MDRLKYALVAVVAWLLNVVVIRPMNGLMAGDSWIIDHLFQPIVNRLADRGWSNFRLARWSLWLSGASMLGNLAVNTDTGWLYTHGVAADAIATFLILVLVLLYWGMITLYTWGINQDERGSQNVWVLPISRLRNFPVRVIWTAFFMQDILVYTAFADQLWSCAQQGTAVAGMYFWACRTRPPGRPATAPPTVGSKQGVP